MSRCGNGSFPYPGRRESHPLLLPSGLRSTRQSLLERPCAPASGWCRGVLRCTRRRRAASFAAAPRLSDGRRAGAKALRIRWAARRLDRDSAAKGRGATSSAGTAVIGPCSLGTGRRATLTFLIVDRRESRPFDPLVHSLRTSPCARCWPDGLRRILGPSGEWPLRSATSRRKQMRDLLLEFRRHRFELTRDPDRTRLPLPPSRGHLGADPRPRSTVA
jgi:hypothetical protein